MKIENYKQTLTVCTRNLRRKTRKEIRSCSKSTAAQLDGVNLHIARDTTTWD
jgi:hypothetical protein